MTKFHFDAETWEDFAASVLDNVPDDAHDTGMTEANPYHGRDGRFTTKGGGGVFGPDLGASEPTVLDANGNPWLDATGEHTPGWGPRGQLNENGEEVLSAKGLGGYYHYAVPRGYADVVNTGHNGKGFTSDGHGIAYTKPVKGEQHFEARFGDHNYGPPTHIVKLYTTQQGKGGLHTVYDGSGKHLGTVADQGSKWVKHTDGTEYGGGGMLGMRYDSKPLAVLGLAQEAVQTGLITEAVLIEFNPYHGRDGRFASKGAYAGGLANLDNKTLAGKAADALEGEGGFTMSLAGTTPDDGIMVSFDKGEGHSHILEPGASPEATRAAVRDWVQQQRPFIKEGGGSRYAGGWLDTSTGKVYLDVSQRFGPGERSAAIAAGKERNQIAIFDLGTFEEIPTGGSGT
jgi:hypothetical protein